jgi:hypothetical protein
MEVRGQLHALPALPPGKEPLVTNWIGGWVGPRAGLDTVFLLKINCTYIMKLLIYHDLRNIHYMQQVFYI